MIRTGDATGGRPHPAEESPRENANDEQRPREASQTPRQALTPYSAGGLPFANGNSTANPCGFPGYGGLYSGTYPIYRFMNRHPRIAHVRRKVFGKIRSNSWGWWVKTGTPEPVAKFARDNLTRL